MVCPKCNEKSLPDGKFIFIKNLKANGEWKFIFKIKFTIDCDLYYCPNCGYNALQNIEAKVTNGGK